MHVARMGLTNQFIEQVEKMEDNFKLLKVFTRLLQIRDKEYYRDILSNLQITDFAAVYKMNDLITKIIKQDPGSISEMLERMKSSEVLLEVKLDNI
jgi:hypothetical protein